MLYAQRVLFDLCWIDILQSVATNIPYMECSILTQARGEHTCTSSRWPENGNGERASRRCSRSTAAIPQACPQYWPHSRSVMLPARGGRDVRLGVR